MGIPRQHQQTSWKLLCTLRTRMAIPRGMRVMPDESNDSWRVTEASLEELVTHGLVRCHRCCEYPTENHVKSSDTKVQIGFPMVNEGLQMVFDVRKEGENMDTYHW